MVDLRVSYIEIYNDIVTDLLEEVGSTRISCPFQKSPSYHVKENNEKGVYIENLSEH